MTQHRQLSNVKRSRTGGIILIIVSEPGARCSVVDEELCYKLQGHGSETQ
jgi:hypothetical protein